MTTQPVPSLAAVAVDASGLVGLPRATLTDLRYQAALIVAACDRELAKSDG